jgi:hypothetical protein
MTAFGLWEFTPDPAATSAAYARSPHGGSESCNCNGCRNFAAARGSVYPPEFVSLLDSLGIDPRKDGEVFHSGCLAPGKHVYGGWFHFVGSLHKTGDFPVVPMSGSLDAWMLHASAPPIESLKGMPLVQIEFHATAVPWVLDEPEAD